MRETQDNPRAVMDEFSARLKWLELLAGERVGRKFMGAKIDVPQYRNRLGNHDEVPHACAAVHRANR